MWPGLPEATKLLVGLELPDIDKKTFDEYFDTKYKFLERIFEFACTLGGETKLSCNRKHLRMISKRRLMKLSCY